MSDKLMPEQVAEYVADDSEYCPYCKLKGVVATSLFKGGTDGVFQEIACINCGARWTDGYTLDRIGCGQPYSFEFVSVPEPEPLTFPSKINLIVEVEGGMVVAIYTNAPSNIEVVADILDHDNKDEDEDSVAALTDEALTARIESGVYREIF